MKNEDTIYENEPAALDKTRSDVAEVQRPKTAAADAAVDKKTGSVWRKAVTGLGGGILLGSVASFAGLTTAAAAPVGDSDQESADHHSDWVDDSISVASSVSDDMTFSEAFAAARAEVGPGGVFEWHGGIYGTYTADEWNSMTAEERDEYGSHFNWNNRQEVADDAVTDDQPGEPQIEPVETQSEESIEDSSDVTLEGSDVSQDPGFVAELPADEILVSTIEETPEVEILGVVHDAESGANIGSMMVDGQEVYLIDVDGGGTFDYMAVDLNHDGQITADEYADISAEHLSVGQLDPACSSDDVYAAHDVETDYVNDELMA